MNAVDPRRSALDFVLISWSGERSGKVAAALHDWLPMVVQTAEPWMSEEDIEKGSRGLDEIGKALAAMGVGIICLTPENLDRPWILFEAGALSKALGDKNRVWPYLFGNLRPENVKPPLGMFQAARAVKDDTRKLVATVNRVLVGPLSEEKLDTVFERMWPELEERLEAVPKVAAAAAPVRSEREMLAELLELSRAAAANVGWSKEALATVLRRMNRLDRQAALAELARSPRFWSGLTPYDVVSEAGAVRPMTLTERLEAGKRALAAAELALGDPRSPIAAGPEGASAEERAERERQIRSVREELERDKADNAKKRAEESK